LDGKRGFMHVIWTKCVSKIECVCIHLTARLSVEMENYERT